MKITDYCPATSPSVDQQGDALQKGLGRAMLWAREGHLDEALLLDACLHDKRFDVTVNECRGDWLWQLIQAVHAEERFRALLFDALDDLREDDAAQVCQLAFQYAAIGDGPFRSRLYQIVEDKPFADARYLGEEEIIRLDGEEALLFAVRLRGRQCENRDWEWDDSVLVDESIERLGEDRVRRLLETASDQDSRRFREAWNKEKDESEKEKRSRSPHAEATRQIPVADIIAAAESPDIKYPHFRGWGMRANEGDLETVFERLLSAQAPKTIANYLKVFSKREFPRIVPELVSLTQHDNPEVRRWAFNSLENNTHPLIREIAKSELEKGVPDVSALGLFIKNYQPGDEQRILESIELPVDENQLHWLLMDVTKILEGNPKADCSQLGLVAYAMTPCSSCRFLAARLLHDRGVAPTWLSDECRFDSESDAQKLFGDPKGQ